MNLTSEEMCENNGPVTTNSLTTYETINGVKKKLPTSFESPELSQTELDNENLYNSNSVDLVTSSGEEQIEEAIVNPKNKFTISLSEYSSKLNVLIVGMDNIYYLPT